MRNYTRLSMRERCHLTTGLSIGEIAKRMGRHRSTRYRELSRNHTRGHYRPGLAHQQAIQRRPRKALKLQRDPSLYHYVYDRLKQGWSPEQIVGRMRLEKRSFVICHETIYRYVYQHGQKKLWQYLPSKRIKRRKQHARKSSSCRYGDIRLITKRPKNIEQRDCIGHWGGDLMAFAGTQKKTVTTLLERKTTMVLLLKNITKESSLVMNNIKDKFAQLSHIPCKTMTFDQGSEFAAYPLIEQSLPCKVYYCQSHSPWQKGSNENMNGRLRRYLPRDISIDHISQIELDQLAERMNTLPRKCLGFRTPKELFLKHIRKSCRTRS